MSKFCPSLTQNAKKQVYLIVYPQRFLFICCLFKYEEHSYDIIHCADSSRAYKRL